MKAKLLIVFLSLAFLVIFPGLSLAQFGSISGRVTDEVTGLPIIGAHVRAMGDTCPGGGCGGAMTDSSGFYMIPHLHPGAYLVSASAYVYEDEVHPDSVIVVAGQNIPNIDFALTPVSGGTGSISGRVTNEVTGYPIAGARITLNHSERNWFTDSAGYYICDNLPPGLYEVHAFADGNYPEAYPEPVEVIRGQNTPNINFALTPLGEHGSISGRVTDEETGLPIIMAHLVAIGLDNWCFGEAWSDTGGQYAILHLCPGTYQVNVHATGYIPETYPDSVIVVAGENTPNINFALTPMGGGTGSISGRVTDEVTGLPLPMAHVRAYGDSGHPCGGEAWTDTAGYYLIPNLMAEQYIVGTHKDGYEDEIYPESVTVEEGQNTPDINFALTPIGEHGSISGRVTDEETGLPIIMAHLVAIGVDNWCYGEAWSDTSGYYMIPNLCAGTYQVDASKPGYVPETYPDSVIVVAGENIPNINFALTPMGGGTGSISGRVTDAETGLPIPMAHVWTYGDSGYPCCGGEASTDTAGYYLIQNLAPRQYIVGVHKCGYQDAVYPESVTVYEGQNTPNIDFALTPIGEPGSISGTITDAQTGEPISWAHVWAYGEFGHGQARTDSLGKYTIFGLYPGSYFVTAWAHHYHPQEYPDTVIVIEGQDTPNIDFALVPYGSPSQGVIAGQVLDDSTLSPIPNAIVFAISFGRNWGFDFTDSVGAYTIQGLQTDDYYVYAFACGYVGEFYDGVYTWEEATLVTPDAYNIDFSLGTCGSWGGSVSGVINSNGSPVEGAFVYAEVSGEVRGFARSSTDGGYVINGLLPGTYTVTASMVMYHDGSYPDPVGVVSGNVDGINIDLPSVRVGDVTGEGTINVTDVIFLINYLYIGGPAPVPLMTGDVNCDGVVNTVDVIYIINYLYIGGPSPCNP
jgi:hypothetical protein